MIVIDGGSGEGGGQIIRTAAALSLITGKPFRVENVRAGRDRPGLRPQHLAAMRAAAEIGKARLEGAEVNTSEFSFEPGPVTPGEYSFNVGTAGSATLVFQTVLPPLLLASGRSRVAFEGGTHNAFAPPFEFLEKTFVPAVNRMGPRVRVTLARYGFYPPGGGCFHAEIAPAPLGRLEILERGEIRGIQACALVANLPRNVGQRELAVVAHRLGLGGAQLAVEESDNALSPGNALTIQIESDALTEVVTAIGERGLRAEIVADRASAEAQHYIASGVPVGSHLADQLLLPMALAGRGSYITGELTQHATTNIDVIRRFLDVPIVARPEGSGRWRVEVG